MPLRSLDSAMDLLVEVHRLGYSDVVHVYRECGLLGSFAVVLEWGRPPLGVLDVAQKIWPDYLGLGALESADPAVISALFLGAERLPDFPGYAAYKEEEARTLLVESLPVPWGHLANLPPILPLGAKYVFVKDAWHRPIVQPPAEDNVEPFYEFSVGSTFKGIACFIGWQSGYWNSIPSTTESYGTAWGYVPLEEIASVYVDTRHTKSEIKQHAIVGAIGNRCYIVDELAWGPETPGYREAQPTDQNPAHYTTLRRFLRDSGYGEPERGQRPRGRA